MIDRILRTLTELQDLFPDEHQIKIRFDGLTNVFTRDSDGKLLPLPKVDLSRVDRRRVGHDPEVFERFLRLDVRLSIQVAKVTDLKGRYPTPHNQKHGQPRDTLDYTVLTVAGVSWAEEF